MKLNKYNSIKGEGTFSFSGIIGGSVESSTTPVGLDRSIWGQHDAGNNVGGDFLCNGNAFIISEDADNPEGTETLLSRYNTMFSDEGNLYVEKGIKADGGAEFGEKVIVGGDFSVGGNVNITGNADVTGDLTAKMATFSEIMASNGHIDDLTSQYIEATSVFVESDLYAEVIEANDIATSTFTADSAEIEWLSGKDLEFLRGVVDELTSKDITTENLKVTKQAHFFELIIDKIKSAGGAVILSPADGFKVDIVQDKGLSWRLLWKAEDGEKAINNMWEDGDQAICQTFNNAQVGGNYNVSNKYYWALVCGVGSIEINNKATMEPERYNYIDLSKMDYDGTLNPEVGDEIVMLGSRTSDVKRQSAIYISAYNSVDTSLQAPLFCHYKGINDFNLSNHKYTWFASNGNTIRGNLLVESGQKVEDVVASQIDIDKFQFNLLDGTKDFSGDCFSKEGHFSLTGKEQAGCKVAEVDMLKITAKNLDKKKTYTLSFWANTDRGEVEIETCYQSNGGEAYEYQYCNNDSWEKFSFELNCSDYGADSLEIVFNAEDANFQIAAVKLEEGKVKDPVWAPSLKDLESDDVEWYSLRPQKEVAAFDKDKKLNIDLQYQVIRFRGGEQEVVKMGDGIMVDFMAFGGDLDEQSYDGKEMAELKIDDFVKYFGYEDPNEIYTYDKDPTIRVQLWVGKEVYDVRHVPIIYEPYAILEITDDKIRTAVGDVEGRVSTLEQTATSIQTTVKDNYDSLMSQITQTAEGLRGEFTNADDEIRSLISVTADEIRSEISNDTTFALTHPNILEEGGKIGNIQTNDRYFYWGDNSADQTWFINKKIENGTPVTVRLIGKFGWAIDIFQNTWSNPSEFTASRTQIPENLRYKNDVVIDITWNWVQTDDMGNGKQWLRFRSQTTDPYIPADCYLKEIMMIEGDSFPKDFSWDDYSTDPLTSIIQQNNDQILAQVNNTYIKIGDGNIVLNGDTQVNGTVIVKDGTGFSLIGDGGSCNISATSIGSYEDFSSNVYHKYSLESRGGFAHHNEGDYETFDYEAVYPLFNDMKVGQRVILGFIYHTVSKTAPTHGNAVEQDMSNRKIGLINIDTKEVLGLRTLPTRDVEVEIPNIFDEFIPKDGNYGFFVRGKVYIQQPAYVWPDWQNKIPADFQFSTHLWINSVQVSADAVGQLAYDGFGINFGGGKNAFFNKDMTIIKYGAHGLKITQDGIKKLNGDENTWVNLSTPKCRLWESPSDTLRDDDELIYFNLDSYNGSSLTAYYSLTVDLPRVTYNGRKLRFIDLTTNGERRIAPGQNARIYNNTFTLKTPDAMIYRTEEDCQPVSSFDVQSYPMADAIYLSGRWYVTVYKS